MKIIKEELSRVLSEGSGPIPKGALVRNSADPIGISFEVGGSGYGGDGFDYIDAWDLSPELLGQIAAREDLAFKYYGKEVSGHDFMKILLGGWYKSVKLQKGQGYVSSLPDWVYKTLGVPSLEDEDK